MGEVFGSKGLIGQILSPVMELLFGAPPESANIPATPSIIDLTKDAPKSASEAAGLNVDSVFKQKQASLLQGAQTNFTSPLGLSQPATVNKKTILG
jgi:hypothetical protein